MYYRHGEELVINTLKARGHNVQDVSSNSEYWHKDIDAITELGTIEIKTDNRISETGNLFIETFNECSKGGKGWFRFCEAQFIFYTDAANKITYIFLMDELKQYISIHEKEYETRNVRDYNGKRSYGLLVPLRELQNNIGLQILNLN